MLCLVIGSCVFCHEVWYGIERTGCDGLRTNKGMESRLCNHGIHRRRHHREHKPVCNQSEPLTSKPSHRTRRPQQQTTHLFLFLQNVPKNPHPRRPRQIRPGLRPVRHRPHHPSLRRLPNADPHRSRLRLRQHPHQPPGPDRLAAPGDGANPEQGEV